MSSTLIPSSDLEHQTLLDFLRQDHLIFRHLDWRDPDDFVSEPGSFVLIEGGEILAILACQVEAAGNAWLRFFTSRRDGKHSQYFGQLIQAAPAYLKTLGANGLYALAPYDWAENLLSAHKFRLSTSIVTLSLALDESLVVPIPPTELSIRPLRASDLPAVQQIDAQAFPPEWQLHPESLRRAYLRGANSSLGLLDGQAVAYQISTATLSSAHLARLAVLPAYHSRSFASTLVRTLLRDCAELGISEIEVNTQADNHASLNLYTHLGFEPINAPLLVYRLQI